MLFHKKQLSFKKCIETKYLSFPFKYLYVGVTVSETFQKSRDKKFFERLVSKYLKSYAGFKFSFDINFL